jgi:hypothetical protein
VLVMESAETLRCHSVLAEPAALEKPGAGQVCLLQEDERGKVYGRAVTIADLLNDNRVLLHKWVRRLTNWNGRQVPRAVWDQKIVPLLERKLAAHKHAGRPHPPGRAAHCRASQSGRRGHARAGGFAWRGFLETD